MERRRGSLISANFAEPIDLSNPNPNYLTIVALEDGLTASLSTNDVEYSIDGNDNWTTLSAGTASPAINTGQYISFRGTLTPTSSKGVGRFKISKSCDLTGNCMSLLFGNNAKSNKSLSGKNYAFYKLFYNCSTIKNVSSNFLPATTLAKACYRYMFQSCTYLTTAPELPATTLASSCYQGMFNACSSLTTTPQLPATTLASYCYQYMFLNCASLKIVPSILPATTLVSDCYYEMFSGCSSLTTAPALPATTLAFNCYYYMFANCSKLNHIKAMFTTTPSTSYTNNWVSNVARTGTFVKNKNATWNVTGTSGIPSGWTVAYDWEDSEANLITFTIDGIEYQAEEGMTWGEWVDSKYNINGDFFIDLDNSISSGSYWIGTEYDYVFSSDIIQEGYKYFIVG